jgi:hypothetical protein
MLVTVELIVLFVAIVGVLGNARATADMACNTTDLIVSPHWRYLCSRARSSAPAPAAPQRRSQPYYPATRSEQRRSAGTELPFRRGLGRVVTRIPQQTVG